MIKIELSSSKFDPFLVFFYNNTINTHFWIYRIDGNRQEWIPLISAHQNLKTGVTLYVCDLHFKQQDLMKNGSTIRLKPGATPEFITNSNYAAAPKQFQIQISTQSSQNSNSGITTQPTTISCTNMNDMKQLTGAQFQRLVDDSIELIKARKLIEKLTAQILKKDVIIEKLNKQTQESISIAHLTLVLYTHIFLAL